MIIPRTLASWRDIALCVFMAASALWAEPSALLAVAWAWALITTWGFRVEHEGHQVTFQKHRELVRRVKEYQSSKTERIKFPDWISN